MKPNTRKEAFMMKHMGFNVNTPTPATREEMIMANAPGGGGSGGGSADWNASEGEAGHVKNKPFYEETNAVPVMDMDVTTTYFKVFRNIDASRIVAGNTYAVTFDGKTYNCAAFEADGITALGNGVLADGQFGDGENTPFLVTSSKSDRASVKFLDLKKHTISIADKNGVFVDGAIEITDVNTPTGDGFTDSVMSLGKTYIVIFDGNSYECIAKVADDGYWLGNARIAGYGDEDNGMPFYLHRWQGDRYFELFTADSGVHRLNIFEKSTIIRKLDIKYLPIDEIKAALGI